MILLFGKEIYRKNSFTFSLHIKNERVDFEKKLKNSGKHKV